MQPFLVMNSMLYFQAQSAKANSQRVMPVSPLLCYPRRAIWTSWNSLDISTPIMLVRDHILDPSDRRCPYTPKQDHLDFLSDTPTGPSKIDERVECFCSASGHVDR